MSRQRLRIGVVAPASRMSPEVAERVPAVAARLYPDWTPEIVFHPQCFASHGHFAGDDEARAQAFLDIANDDSFDAVWFARGGYGSCRVVEAVIGRLTEASRRKTYLGYSDAGALLAALYRAGFAAVAHGPVAQDILRDGGDAAVGRALAWMVERAPAALEPTVNGANKTAAFNITVLSQLLGTPLQPDLAGHVLMLEEVSGGDVPDRPLALSHHQQRRYPAGRRHHAGPLQRHHPERAGFRDDRGGGCPALVPAIGDSLAGSRRYRARRRQQDRAVRHVCS